MDDRLTRVEEKLAHLERHVGELDGVVREGFDRIEELSAELRRLNDRLAQQSEPGEGDGPDAERDRPPHW